MWLSYILLSPAADDVLMLVMFVALPVMAALAGYSGRPVSARRGGLIPVAGLCLCAGMTGVALMVAVHGYAARTQAQVREAVMVSRAWEYAGVFSEPDAREVRQILKAYLSDRIAFYHEGTGSGLHTWSGRSQERLTALWGRVEREGRHDSSRMAVVLPVISGLQSSLLLTRSVWRRDLPDVVWYVLILVAGYASWLAGAAHPAGRSGAAGVVLLPGLLGVVLFITAETDLPGEGVIRVEPVALEHLAQTLGP